MKFKLTKSNISKKEIERIKNKVFIKSEIHRIIGIFERLILEFVDNINLK